jgi:hypothetical protein
MLTLISMFTVNAYAEPAIVFEGDLCFVGFYPNYPDQTDGFALLGNKLHATQANSGNETTPFAPGQVTCQGNDDLGLEKPAVVRAPCVVFGTPLGDIFTERGIVAASPSGNWSAQCIFNKDTGRQN